MGHKKRSLSPWGGFAFTMMAGAFVAGWLTIEKTLGWHPTVVALWWTGVICGGGLAWWLIELEKR